MDLPENLRVHLGDILQSMGVYSPIQSVNPLGGGCINRVFRIDTKNERFLLKWNEQSPPGMFPAESKGLGLLRDSGVIRVPDVYAVSDTSIDLPGYLLLEWLGNDAGKAHRGRTQEMLGQQLALLHQASFPSDGVQMYGLNHDNFIGSSPQWNDWGKRWLDFFRDMRLGKQMEIAEMKGMMPLRRKKLLIRLMEHLGDWIDESICNPSLLHGDLWGGNVMSGPEGEPVLIDPAVYFGDREAEIAFTEMFGGFDRVFYESYQSIWPLDQGYNERKSIYNIYHLLNHMNIFGGSYAAQVDSVLRRYVGG